MSEEDYEIVEPDPAALSESLRAFGYTPETSIADLVDNSISAGARTIDVIFHWSGRESWVAVVDDGHGMSDAELRLAMKPGSRNPREIRDADDLGRFGLGLKTASFSQCRHLTVTSQRAGETPCSREWSLDEIVRSGEWRLLRSEVGPGVTLAHEAGHKKAWTVVRWSQCDRIAGDTDVDDVSAQRDFHSIVERVSGHLSMTFHRFIGGKRLRIRVNGRTLERWDPFLDSNPATQNLGEEILHYAGGKAVITPYVLPHRSKLKPDEYNTAGGPAGWNALQGFYVYRNRRLLVAGDWLGLRLTKEEHYKLARIEIDITNETDEAWQIDVRKSVAVPPPEVRSELARIAKATRERAVTVYRHRGKAVTRDARTGVSLLWVQKARHGKIRYEIDRTHPAVERALGSPNRSNVTALIRLIEETIPVPLISINASEHPDDHAAPLEGVTPRQVVELARDFHEIFMARGETFEEAIRSVMATDPFHLYPELAEDLASNDEETTR